MTTDILACRKCELSGKDCRRIVTARSSHSKVRKVWYSLSAVYFLLSLSPSLFLSLSLVNSANPRTLVLFLQGLHTQPLSFLHRITNQSCTRARTAQLPTFSHITFGVFLHSSQFPAFCPTLYNHSLRTSPKLLKNWEASGQCHP